MKAKYGADDMPTNLYGKLLLRYDILLYRFYKVPERFLTWMAWHAPKKLVYWCAIRLMAHATTGQYGNTNPTDLKVMDALDRWGY